MVPLKQFRDRYPTATITSEFLGTHGDRLMVKVTIQTETHGTATGLAADTSLEVAEDRAQQRALAALGFTDSAEIPGVPQPLPQADLPAAFQNGDQDSSSVPLHEKELQPEREAIAAPKPKPLPHKTADKPTVAATAKPVRKPQSQSAAVDQAPEPPLDDPAASPDADFSLQHQSVNEPTSQPLPAPINLSDVIAQTDVELRRLGWSIDDGRNYLQTTYSKKSRHELTDEELIAFLLHLETLPTPS